MEESQSNEDCSKFGALADKVSGAVQGELLVRWSSIRGAVALWLQEVT
jgi:hypothetical protein